MPNSIYNQLAAGLRQAAGYGQRSILFRGKVIQCTVLLGSSSTALMPGGLNESSTIHCKVPRAEVAIGNDGEPHTNESVTVFPQQGSNTLEPQECKIEEIVAEEYCYNFSLVDTSK